MQDRIYDIIARHSQRHSEGFRETFYRYAQAYDQWVQGYTGLDDEELRDKAAEFADACPAAAQAILRHHRRTGDVSEAHVKVLAETAEIVRARRVGFFVSC